MEKTCWNCNKKIDKNFFYCSVCNVIQHIKDYNYFELFNLEKQFSIKLETLDQNYFRLQQQFHPDRMLNATDKDKIIAIQNSMVINEAYQTLKSPVQRATYLLSLQGIKLGDEQDAVKPSVILLQEIMEQREKIDDCTDTNILLNIEEANLNFFNQTAEEFAKQYNSNDFISAAQTAIKMRYIDKILIEIKNKRTEIN